VFPIGSQVRYGNHKCQIIESLDNGKIYNIRTQGGDQIYASWTDLFLIRESEPDSLVSKESFEFHFNNFSIESLLHMYYGSYAGIDLNPDYQRGLVWTLEDKVSLIDSIFNNIEIGKFVLIHMPYSVRGKSYTILDGKQRLTTLIEFYEDGFSYRGFKYSELSRGDQYHFKEFSTSTAKADSNQLTKEMILLYFLRLNTTGKTQTKNHLDHVKELLRKELEK
jgi:hypothetical protein